MPSRLSPDIKKALLVVILGTVYFITCFSLLYIVYKHYNYELVPGDLGHYLALADNPLRNEVVNPFKYRILTPSIVHVIAQIGPEYNSQISKGFTPHERRILFWFCFVNYAFLCGAAALTAHLCAFSFGLPWWAAVTGGYLLLCAFPSVVTSIMPSTDAGAVFFILLSFQSLRARRHIWFTVALFGGVLQKETVGIVIFGILILEQIQSPRPLLFWFAVFGAATAMHLVFKTVAPASGFEYYYDGRVILNNFISAFNPATYTPTVLRHNLLSNLSVIVAAMVHLLFWIKGVAPIAFPFRWLLLLPYLFFFGISFVDGNNVMRVVYLASPFAVGYQVTILHRLWQQLTITQFVTNLA